MPSFNLLIDIGKTASKFIIVETISDYEIGTVHASELEINLQRFVRSDHQNSNLHPLGLELIQYGHSFLKGSTSIVNVLN